MGNLPHNCAEEELVELFTKYGKVSASWLSSSGARLSSFRLWMSGLTRKLEELKLLEEDVMARLLVL